MNDQWTRAVEDREVKIPKYAEVRRVNTDDGMVYYDTVKNVEDGKFLIDQVYSFPVNSPDDDSVTVLRCVIPAGTLCRKGYSEIRNVLSKMGLDPKEVSVQLELPEIMA